MLKKWLCGIACALHILLAGAAMVWVANDGNIPGKKGGLITDGLFIIICIIIGITVLKLDLDKLFLKFEIGVASRCEKTVFLAGLIAAICIVGFEILMVLVYFCKGVKMEFSEFVRFMILPSLSLAHLATGAGSYLAFQYFTVYRP